MRERIETALDEGRLFAIMSSGATWRMRRNGKTKTWKTRPHQFSIPVKVGLKITGRIDHTWIEGQHFIVKPSE